MRAREFQFSFGTNLYLSGSDSTSACSFSPPPFFSLSNRVNPATSVWLFIFFRFGRLYQRSSIVSPRRGDSFTMATMTVTTPSSKVAKKNAKQVPENERYIRACSDIANALIQEYESQKDISKPRKDINLNKLRGTIAKKHALPTLPPLTAIISAVPEHYKKYILPKLIAKPIRMSKFPAEVLLLELTH